MITDGDEMMKALNTPVVECPKHKSTMKYVKHKAE